ncbi:MAG: sigma 54-interacting transcriptional regulator [Myxococcota bacterium]
MQTTETDTLSLDRVVLEKARLPRLTVVRHPEPALLGIGETIADGTEHQLGRAASFLAGVCDVGRVSRRHAALAVADRTVVLRDLDSRNGTQVNGEKIEDPVVLQEGDVVGLGPVLLLFHHGPRHHREPDHPRLWGSGHAMAQLLEELERAAHDGEPTVLVGETGTGKELAARELHEKTGRSGAFIPLNCAALEDGVVASELFGHERGAFSGAASTRRGLVESADGGTLYLDELTSASPRLQAALLRVLEDGAVRKVGATASKRADVQFVAAVQEDGPAEARLRDDLWFRLARRRVRLPPLRERREDIPLLAQRFVTPPNEPPIRLGRRLTLTLLTHPWPGNVRELRAVMEQLIQKHAPVKENGVRELEVAPSQLPRLAAPALPCDVVPPPRARTQGVDHALEPAPPGRRAPAWGRRRRRPGRAGVEAALRAHDGRVSDAARALGVARRTLYRWLEHYHLDADTYRPEEPE